MRITHRGLGRNGERLLITWRATLCKCADHLRRKQRLNLKIKEAIAQNLTAHALFSLSFVVFFLNLLLYSIMQVKYWSDQLWNNSSDSNDRQLSDQIHVFQNKSIISYILPCTSYFLPGTSYIFSLTFLIFSLAVLVFSLAVLIFSLALLIFSMAFLIFSLAFHYLSYLFSMIFKRA